MEMKQVRWYPNSKTLPTTCGTCPVVCFFIKAWILTTERKICCHALGHNVSSVREQGSGVWIELYSFAHPATQLLPRANVRPMSAFLHWHKEGMGCLWRKQKQCIYIQGSAGVGDNGRRISPLPEDFSHGLPWNIAISLKHFGTFFCHEYISLGILMLRTIDTADN